MKGKCAAALFGSAVLSVIVDYIVYFFVAPTSNMEFQVKVEYTKDKRITFMVSSRLVTAARHRFKDDITSRCATLNYSTETTIRLLVFPFSKSINHSLNQKLYLTSNLLIARLLISPKKIDQ